MRLPGLPSTVRGIRELATRQGWAMSDQHRKLDQRGGGYAYNTRLLPPIAQARLAQMEAEAQSLRETQEKRRALYWRAFEAMTDAHRQIAHDRLALIHAAEEALAKRELATAPVSIEATLHSVLKRFKVSASSYYAIRSSLKGIDREDWLAALAPGYAEGGTVSDFAECHPDAWAALKSDYLRLEKPAFSACYRRVIAAAKRHGWSPIPHERSLRRRMDAEVPASVQLTAREGRKRAEQLYPAQVRTKTDLHAMQVVNTDGHKIDLFVQVPWKGAGEWTRVTLLGTQDVYSGKILSWRLCEAETWDVVQAVIGDMIEDFGIPEHLYMDNGKAFASKKISGGHQHRIRFKFQGDEVAGLLKTLGIEPHFTKPYSGQSKPIERAWRDLAEEICKHPAMAGAYTGPNPQQKPENYGKRAIPLDVLEKHVAASIVEHNARTGRRSETAKGRSFDETFSESMQHPATIVRRATPAQHALWLLASQPLTTSKKDGSIRYKGNVYWNIALKDWLGEKVTIRFDPAKLHDPVKVYDAEGRLICDAPCTEKVGFTDAAKAARHERNRKRLIRLQREEEALHRQHTANQLADLYSTIEPPSKPAPVRPTITRLVTGNLAVEPQEDAMSDEEFAAAFSRGFAIASGDSSIIPFPSGKTTAGKAGRKSRAEK
ncbi:transposase domain-containing protein [Ensifer soli]|uniref:transposase domain-containing protein n=1 Tax=Ciceribacter sp. sgz301302 TaxID=3342379 RepID=UPI0035B7A996